VPFPDFNPVALAIPTPWFTFAIRWYALAYVAGILIGWRYAVGLVRNARLWGGAPPPADDALIDDLILWVTLGVIGGGRLGYMVFYSTSTLWRDPLQIIRTWEGGMSFHGGLIGVSLALIGFSMRKGVSTLRIADLAAPCVPIGLLFGRIANFVNGELWGRTTDLPWGIIFPHAGPSPRHPSQLYEAALEGLVLFLVLRTATHRLRWLSRPGAVSGLFLACYGVFRFALEHVREPDAGMPDFPFGLSMGMILSLPMVVIGLGLILYAMLSEPVGDPDPGSSIEPGEMQERLSAYPHSVLPGDWVDRVRRGEPLRRRSAGSAQT
jgi:phosphatidylglycerol---prolipoprotein diacylglyceryl transferase